MQQRNIYLCNQIDGFLGVVWIILPHFFSRDQCSYGPNKFSMVDLPCVQQGILVFLFREINIQTWNWWLVTSFGCDSFFSSAGINLFRQVRTRSTRKSTDSSEDALTTLSHSWSIVWPRNRWKENKVGVQKKKNMIPARNLLSRLAYSRTQSNNYLKEQKTYSLQNTSFRFEADIFGGF